MIIDSSKIFQDILNVNDETLKFILGDFGLNLKLFLNNLDFDHPSCSNIFDKNDKYFSTYCSELLKLTQFARDNNLETILPLMKQVFESSNIFLDVQKNKKSKLYVRLLKDNGLREDIRSLKKRQDIDLYFLKNDQDFWDSQPDSFNDFKRFSLSYKDKLKETKRIQQIYERLGFSSLAKENKLLADSIESENDLYFGFHNIKITSIAIIFAKILKCSFKDGSIKIDNFYNKINLDYRPKIYPLKEFWAATPESLKSFINYLENFPEVNNKPIFDHFGLVVPSFDLLEEDDEKFSFIDLEGKPNVFYNRDEALRELDLFLLKNNLINSIVVGEKDGNCYFLRYFDETN